MNTSPLRIGLIGVVGTEDRHLHALETLEREGMVRLIGVAASLVGNFEEVKAKLESRQVHWYADFQKLIEEESDLDAMAIASPMLFHAKMTAAALARGLFVYLEEPPVPLIQQLNDLIALDARRKVAVGFQILSGQAVRQLKQWKIEGGLGEIQSIRVSAGWPKHTFYYNHEPWAGKMLLKEEPVFDGPATNASAHLLHSIMFLAGKEMENFDLPCDLEGEFYRARPIEGYDVVSIRGRLESGVTFCYAVSHAIEKMQPYKIEMIGSKGRAWISDNGNTVGNDCGLNGSPDSRDDSFLQSYRDFVEFARGQRRRAITHLEDSRGCVLVTNGALVSSGGIHTIGPKYWRMHGSAEMEGYHVHGIWRLLERSASEGKLFSEMGAPWAKKGNTVLLHSLRSLKLRDYISQ